MTSHANEAIDSKIVQNYPLNQKTVLSVEYVFSPRDRVSSTSRLLDLHSQTNETSSTVCISTILFPGSMLYLGWWCTDTRKFSTVSARFSKYWIGFRTLGRHIALFHWTMTANIGSMKEYQSSFWSSWNKYKTKGFGDMQHAYCMLNTFTRACSHPHLFTTLRGESFFNRSRIIPFQVHFSKNTKTLHRIRLTIN